MFDTNQFKAKIKEWIRENPNAKIEEVQDICEEIIPPQLYSQYHWLVNHTVDWYKHIQNLREHRVPLQ